MDIATIQPRQGKLEIEGEITEVGEARAFNKFGKEGKVANAVLQDSTGSVKLTLWNEQADQVKVGDKIKISNGWSDEYKGELQVSTGRFGTLTVLGKTESPQPGQSKTEADEEDIQY
ncbi:MAG: SOSS complex subunit B family protein [Nanoarchaeota archaeon]